MAQLLTPFAAALLVPALLAQPEPRLVRPFFSLRIDNARVFEDSGYAPLFAGWAQLLAARFGVEGEAGNAELGELWRGIVWPLEVDALLEAGAGVPLAGIRTPAQSTALLPPLVALGRGSLTEGRALEREGVAWVRADVGDAATALEGVQGAQRVLLLGTHRADDASALAALDLWLRSTARANPAREALLAHARGGDLGFAFDYRALVGRGARNDGILVGVLRVLFGGQFAGIAGRIAAARQRLQIGLWGDIKPGRGYLGACVQPEPRELGIAGWVPPEATDWVAFDVHLPGALRQLNLLSAFGRGVAFAGDKIAPADLHSDLAFLGDLDVKEVLDTHLTGQAFAASEVGIETFLDAGAGDLPGFVVGVGCFDAVRAVAELRQHFGASGAEGTRIEETPALGPGVLTAFRDGEPAFYLAAQKGVVLGAPANPAGEAMLRKCLATAGKGAAGPERVATMLGRGHVLGPALEILEEGASGARGGEAARVVREFLRGHDTAADWRLVVDQSGARLEVEL